MQPEPPPWASHPELEIQAEIIERLSGAVRADASWRWLEVGCSLASGRGDRLSDVDAAVGYADQLVASRLEAAGLDLIEAGGDVLDVLIHMLPGAPADTRRFAVEYGSGVQLDLLAMPVKARIGLPDGDVAVVDKDGVLADRWRPAAAEPPTVEQAREWAMLGWWAISDAAKFLRRGSFYEAVERVAEARQHALRLFAASRRIPYSAFGLVSLLDFPPYELPPSLAQTYCVPTDRAAVHRAAEATADLLAQVSDEAERELALHLSTRWSKVALERLVAASRS